ncbi:hypothetical protein MFRU_033g00330 [Monilinia fructicola]|nr:hypothetical protein MFRU_033g00330 [Monilinia fructicola]
MQSSNKRIQDLHAQLQALQSFNATFREIRHESRTDMSRSSKLRGLSREEAALLRKKQSPLAASALSTLECLLSGTHIRNLWKPNLFFAQHEAGAAVCVDPSRWILPCSHCFEETDEEHRENPRPWLSLYTGLAVEVECRAWDLTSDLAL